MSTQSNKKDSFSHDKPSSSNDVAILLDLDNLVIGAKQINLVFDVNLVLEHIKKLTNGRIVLRHSYGDWRQDQQMMRDLATAGFVTQSAIRLNNFSKNLADMQIVVDTIRKVGQQSLAVFVSSLIIAQMVGAFFNIDGRDWFVVLVGNLVGFALLIAIAHSVAWFKSQPWRIVKQQVPVVSRDSASAGFVPNGVPAKRAD